MSEEESVTIHLYILLLNIEEGINGFNWITDL